MWVSSLFAVVLGLAFLMPFYQWVLFGQTTKHKASLVFATRFLLIHGLHELLLFVLGDLAISVGFGLLAAYMWSVQMKKKVAVAPASTPSSDVWPPPPTVPADGGTMQ